MKLEIEEFRDLVFEVVSLIPKGRATSYGAIAKTIGYPTHSRLVGKIMSGSSSKENIPAHRVVNSQGVLSGRNAFGTAITMQNLLEAEGIVVENNRIKGWKNVFWNPIEELDIE